MFVLEIFILLLIKQIHHMIGQMGAMFSYIAKLKEENKRLRLSISEMMLKMESTKKSQKKKQLKKEQNPIC